MDPKTLKELAANGDVEAARELLQLAKHRDDRGALLVAAATLGETETLAGLAAEAWRRGHEDEVAKIVAIVGVSLGPREMKQLVAILDEVNGARRARILPLSTVLEALFDARHRDHGFAWRHAGEANDGNQRTTLSLAACSEDGKSITVGIALAGARGASPGRAWAKLQPWRRHKPQKNLAAVRAWAMDQEVKDRIVLPIVESTMGAGDPVQERERALAVLLDGDPGEAAFKSIRALIDDWPDEDRNGAIQRANAALESWPLWERAAGHRWFKGKEGPSSALVTTYHIGRKHDLERYHKIIHSGGLAKVRALSWIADKPSGVVEALTESDSVANLEAMDLSAVDRAYVTPLALERLTASDRFPALRELILHRAIRKRPKSDAISTFEDFNLGALERLELFDGLGGPGGVPAALIETVLSHPKSRVRELSVFLRPAKHTHLKAFAEHLGASPLRTLSLGSSERMKVERLASAIAGLTELRLTKGTRDGYRAIAESDALAGTRGLALDFPATPKGGDDVLAALGANPSVAGLERLSLTLSGVTSAGIEALTRSPYLLGLRSLELVMNELDPDAVRLLVDWPGFADLRRLNLASCPIRRTGVELLRDALHPGLELVGIVGLSSD